MILVVAATEFELDPLVKLVGRSACDYFVCGVGPVEAGIKLATYLSQCEQRPELIINCGIAGGYLSKSGIAMASVGEICLAEKEVFGDLGVDIDGEIESLGKELVDYQVIDFNLDLVKKAAELLAVADVAAKIGTFVTVNSVSGRKKRGCYLQHEFGGLCENMEGAALARVCKLNKISLVELRCISNLVEDRDLSSWDLKSSVEGAARSTAVIIENLL